MKNKIVSIILAVLMIAASVLLIGCGQTHACENKCEVCGKCADAECTEEVCAEKCACPLPHTCENKCAVCNKCTDAQCTEAACADKCECESNLYNIICPDRISTVSAFFSFNDSAIHATCDSKEIEDLCLFLKNTKVTNEQTIVSEINKAVINDNKHFTVSFNYEGARVIHSQLRNGSQITVYALSFEYELMNGNMVVFSLYYYNDNTLLLTPNGNYVQYTQKYLNDLPDEVKADLIIRNQETYSELQLVSGCTTSYNCHSFAWHSQNINVNDIWLGLPNTYYSLQDSSYIRVYEPRKGDIVSYFDTDADTVYQNIHSGIIVDVLDEESNNICGEANRLVVKSKWGMNALYIHKGDEAPYTSNYGGEADEVRYYRPRTDSTYTLTNPSTNTTQSVNTSFIVPDGATSVIEKYRMYELTINSPKNYTLSASGNSLLDLRLYNTNMQLIDTNLTETLNNGVYSSTMSLSLDASTYYFRVAHHNTNDSGEINVQITNPHVHDLNPQSNSTQHWQQCSYCGSEADRVNHSFDNWTPSVNNTSATHTGECICGVTQNQNHTFTYTDNEDDSTHSKDCSACGYTANEAHSYYYGNANIFNHYRLCFDCDYSMSCNHVWRKSGEYFTCRMCGFTSLYIPVLPSKSADLWAKLIAATPKGMNECFIYLEEGVFYYEKGQYYQLIPTDIKVDSLTKEQEEYWARE